MKINNLRHFIATVALFTFSALLCTLHADAQIIHTICGNGTGSYSGDGGSALSATINQDVTVAVDGAGNLYIGDFANHRIRKITLATGIISTVAGTGTPGFSGDGGSGSSAQINGPSGVWADNAGNVYIADVNNHRVRMVNTSGVINTIAGTGTASYSGDGGPATSATFNGPGRVFTDAAGNIYVSDRNNYCIRKINTSGVISTFAGNGSSGFSGDGGAATSAQMNVPFCLEADASGNIYIADLYNNRVRVVNTSGVINTFAGTGSGTFSGDGGPATSAGVDGPEGLAFDAAGNFYIGDNTAASLGDDRIRIVNTSNIINTFAGTGSTGFSGDGGPATAATFNIPGGLARYRNAIYVADQFNNRVRRIGITNVTPVFTAGATAILNVCQSASATSIVTQLAVLDSDDYQPMTWSLFVSPANGSVAGLPYTMLTNGSVATPSGITYTPTTSYVGRDSFRVVVFDGVVYDTIQVNVTISPAPSAGTIRGASTVCVGASITLTDTTSGGTWSSSNPSLATIATTGAVNGIATGSLTISYTVTNSCGTSYATYPITVVNTPVSGIISGATAVCVGQSITLSTTGTGGAWSATNGNATVDATGNVAGITAGIDSILYSVTNACGTAVDTQVVTINPLPAAITGAAPICAGGNTLILTETTTGGTWSTSNATIASVNAVGTVTSVAAGTVNISYTLTATGCYVSVPITVNPLPAAISGGASLCLGTSTTLTTTSTGGSWTTSNAAIASVDASGNVTGLSTGSATITYALTATGCYVTHAITVTSVPPAISGGSFVCVGNSNVMSNTVTGGTWATSNATIASIDASGNLYGLVAGSATITYSSGGCFTTLAITVGSAPGAITGPTSVCAGSNITLSNASTGGTWTVAAASIGSINAASGVFTGVSAGSTTVTYSFTAASGCYSTTTITVNPNPTAIAGPDSVCEAGGTITLTNATTGGAWVSADGSIAAVTGSGGVVTGVAAGTVTISYTVGGCAATTSLTVVALPGAYISALGDTMLCPGGSVALIAGTVSGASYQWYRGGTAISGASTAFYTASSPGNYRVFVTSGFGCTSSSAPVSVTVNPATAIATAAGATTFCSGGSVVLSANTGAGFRYQWLNSGTGIAGATNSTYSATATGSYAVIVTNGPGCSATSTAIAVSVTTMPSVGVTIVGSLTLCSGDSLNLIADFTAGATYQWQVGATDIVGETARTFSPYATGSYRVVATNGGCVATSSAVTVTVNPTPIANVRYAGATTFCAGGSITLRGTAGIGDAYQWLNGTTAIAGATDSTYTATTTGSYRIRVTNASGCSSISSIPVTVIVNSRPLPSNINGADTVCLGGTTNFTTATGGGTWAVSIGNASITGGGRVTGMRIGADTLRYTLTNSCGTATSLKAISVVRCTTGIDEITETNETLTVYPNPTTGSVTISTTAILNSIAVTNLLGQVVVNQSPATHEAALDLASQPAGVYFIRVNGIHVVRVVKE